MFLLEIGHIVNNFQDYYIYIYVYSDEKIRGLQFSLGKVAFAYIHISILKHTN